MKDPFISICIPAYKKVISLRRLLQSILQQKYTNYEIIITDDTPDDSVNKLVEEFFEKLPIRYYKNSPVAGMPANWNIGMKKATGKWIKIMHDDDWFATATSLEQFAEAAKKTSSDFIFSACNNIYSSSGKEVNEFLIKQKKELLEKDPLNLFYSNVIGHPSTVMHKKDDAVIYDTQFKWVVDVDFYIRYLLKHPGFEYLPEMLINIGIDEHQASNKYYKNPKVEIPEYFKMRNKYHVKLTDNQYVFHAFWLLVRKFKIKNLSEIKDAGYAGSTPDAILSIINYQKKIPRLILKQTPFSNYFVQKCFMRCQKTHA